MAANSTALFPIFFPIQNEDVIILYLNVLQKVGAIHVTWIFLLLNSGCGIYLYCGCL